MGQRKTNRRQAAKSVALATLIGAPWLAAPRLASAQSSAPKGGRLIASAQDWLTLRARISKEPDLATYHQSLLDEARRHLSLPPVAYRKVGRRLLSVSRSLLQRVLLWSYVYKTTDENRYAQRAIQEMLTVAEFADWNPSHFLDVAEMTTGLALGLDWLAGELSPEQSQRIARSIHDLGLQPALDGSAKHNTWHRAEHNWNQVCFGGLCLGALAVQSFYPEASQQIFALAKANIHHGLKPYAPDGVYPEGPSYWGYGTSYQVLMIAALRSAQNDTWQMEQAPGFMGSALSYVQMTGATGAPFNFSDSSDRLLFEPAVFWFAKELNQPALLQFEQAQLKTDDSRRQAVRHRMAVLAALWWPAAQAVSAALPLDWYGRGGNPLVVMRDAWSDSQSLYFAIKGGSASLNHAHMDVGSFVFELDGVRWGIDFGLQAYESLESKGVDLWNKKQTSQRWQVFRLNNHAHSTLTVDGQLHQVSGQGTFSRFDLMQRQATLDMTSVFEGQASKVERSVTIRQRSVLIRDELQGLRPGARVRWQMPTRASVSVQGAAAALTQSGKRLQVKLVEGSSMWHVLSLEQPLPDFNAANPGASMLVCEAIANAQGRADITVHLGAT
jgi:oligo-alginate lyase